MSFLGNLFGNKTRIDLQPDVFDDTPMGIAFRPVWQATAQPTAGAMVYAWNTYGLVPFSVSGTGIAPTRRMQPLTANALYTQQGAIVRGLPIIAGQIQPNYLLNPQNALPPGAV